MSLKLFRSTGFHSILSPGETRVALHPGWAVAGVAGWIAVACNAWLWQALVRGHNPLQPLLAGVAAFGTVAAVLSAFGWRRTFKLAATVALLLAGLLAAGIWTQDISFASVLEGRRIASLLPTWASLFGWQVPLLLVLVGGVPVWWLWHTQLRRLSAASQWKTNVWGVVLYAPLGAAAWWMLARLPA
jgi:lipid A ethanolaminephosphotransferase